jgi:hypothetical protein
MVGYNSEYSYKIFRKIAIAAIAAVTMSMAAGAQEKGDMAVATNMVLPAEGYIISLQGSLPARI